MDILYKINRRITLEENCLNGSQPKQVCGQETPEEENAVEAIAFEIQLLGR